MVHYISIGTRNLILSCDALIITYLTGPSRYVLREALFQAVSLTVFDMDQACIALTVSGIIDGFHCWS